MSRGNILNIEKMTRTLILFFVFISASAMNKAIAQNQNTVIIQNSDETGRENKDGTYWINGISSKEDIGGVDVEIKKTRTENKNNDEYAKYCDIIFTNYNSFKVTVYYHLYGDDGGLDKEGSVVLLPDQSKIILQDCKYEEKYRSAFNAWTTTTFFNSIKVKTIARRLQ